MIRRSASRAAAGPQPGRSRPSGMTKQTARKSTGKKPETTAGPFCVYHGMTPYWQRMGMRGAPQRMGMRGAGVVCPADHPMVGDIYDMLERANAPWPDHCMYAFGEDIFGTYSGGAETALTRRNPPDVAHELEPLRFDRETLEDLWGGACGDRSTMPEGEDELRDEVIKALRDRVEDSKVLPQTSPHPFTTIIQQWHKNGRFHGCFNCALLSGPGGVTYWCQ